MSEAFLCQHGKSIELKKLWDNESPTSAFEGQELEVPGIDSYKAAMIRFGYSTAYPNDCQCVWLFYNAGSTYTAANAQFPTSSVYRSVTVRNTTSFVNFGNVVGSGNHEVIPIAIYGLNF